MQLIYKFWNEETLRTGGVEVGDMSDDEQVGGDELVEEEPELLREENVFDEMSDIFRTTGPKKINQVVPWLLCFSQIGLSSFTIKINAQSEC